MKKYFTHIIILLTLIVFHGCDKFGPTELIDDSGNSDNYQIEVIGNDLDNEYFSNGYDTSGVTTDIRLHTNVIFVSGIKLTRNGNTQNISSAQTILSDTSKPVYSPDGKLIGYNTITPGIVRFNSEQARLTNFRIRFREHGSLIDTILGKKYELFNSQGRFFNDQFIFPYNSNVAFSFTPFLGQQVDIDIPTPKEVTGTVRLNKLQGKERFHIELNWTAEFENNFSVIIGGITSSNQQVFPFFRIKTTDDGSLVLPASLFKNIPKERFHKLTFSFMRKFENTVQLNQGSININSQSIHTIIIDFP